MPLKSRSEGNREGVHVGGGGRRLTLMRSSPRATGAKYLAYQVGHVPGGYCRQNRWFNEKHICQNWIAMQQKSLADPHRTKLRFFEWRLKVYQPGSGFGTIAVNASNRVGQFTEVTPICTVVHDNVWGHAIPIHRWCGDANSHLYGPSPGRPYVHRSMHYRETQALSRSRQA